MTHCVHQHFVGHVMLFSCKLKLASTGYNVSVYTGGWKLDLVIYHGENKWKSSYLINKFLNSQLADVRFVLIWLICHDDCLPNLLDRRYGIKLTFQRRHVSPIPSKIRGRSTLFNNLFRLTTKRNLKLHMTAPLCWDSITLHWRHNDHNGVSNH